MEQSCRTHVAYVTDLAYVAYRSHKENRADFADWTCWAGFEGLADWVDKERQVERPQRCKIGSLGLGGQMVSIVDLVYGDVEYKMMGPIWK